MDFNSIFQLYTLKQRKDFGLTHASRLLFMPDALSYLLTGKMVTEYTIASTSQLLNPETRKLDENCWKSWVSANPCLQIWWNRELKSVC